MSWLRRGPEGDLRAEEGRLVARMLEGDERAFESFSSLYTPALYRFAQRSVGDREATRDVVQATLCKALGQLRSFRGASGLATWLCAICRNEIAAGFRRRQRAPREVELTGAKELDDEPHASMPIEEAPGPEAALLLGERARLVHRALDLLPPHYGHALEWKYLDHLPVDEIARRLELRPKAAESVLTRAREAFRRAFARLQAGEPGQEA